MLVAVTGNMGSGKSTLARMLRDRGAALVDADAESRRVVEESPELRRELAAAFGGDLLQDGVLNRRELARRALADEAGRQGLEALVRPHLEPRLRAAIEREAASSPVVVFDAPLVFEWGIGSWFDRIYVVRTDMTRAAERVAAQRGLSADEVHQRRRAQLASGEHDDLRAVDNNGSLDDLRAMSEQIWNDLTT